MASILLAEDDHAMRTFIKRALEKEGHRVDEAEDGETAFAFLQSGNTYDILLTDIVMPNMDGLELSSKAKKLFPAMPVMFITGFAGMAPHGDESDNGIQIISKPFHLKDIVESVHKILANNPLPNAR